MSVLAYLLVPVLLVAVAATVVWARNRQPTSLQSGVDSFRREMDALSPDAAPVHRRRPEHGSGQGGQGGQGDRPPPRRPPSSDPRG